MARSARSKGLKDERDKEWIRTLDCLVCYLRLFGVELFFSRREDGVRMSEAAHVGPRGMSQKCSDRETLPLCVEHHREGKDAHHVLQKRFWSYHGLDRDALIAELNARYELEHSK